MSQDRVPLSHGDTRIQGLLLAGGRGLRFDPTQKQHKLLARLPDGQTVIRASARKLLPWVDALTVVVGTHNTGVMRELVDLPVRVLVCAGAQDGPGATLRYGLTYGCAGGSARDVDCAYQPEMFSGDERVAGWLIALADMPWIADATYAAVRSALAHGAANKEEGVWQPRFEGRPGHPVAVSTALVERFLRMDTDPERGLSALWRGGNTRVHVLEVDDPGCVQDVDRPEDLRGLGTRP